MANSKKDFRGPGVLTDNERARVKAMQKQEDDEKMNSLKKALKKRYGRK
jgi:hypothetical protein